MKTLQTFIKKSSYFTKSQDSLIYLVILICGLGLIGWLTGQNHLTAFSSDFIPIPHISIIIFLIGSIYLLTRLKYQSQFSRWRSTAFLSVLLLFCLYLLLNSLFKFTPDIEEIFIINSVKYNGAIVRYISPISALLFVLLCIGMVGCLKLKSLFIKYIGCYSSLMVFLLSSIILIAHIYKAPILYNKKALAVSLPSGINFFLFSLTLLRYYEFKIWTFNIKLFDNRITRKLVKSFLPAIVSLILLDGFLDARISIYNINPALKSAIVLIIVIIITIIIILTISSDVGNALHNSEKRLKENEEKFRTVADYTWDWEFWLGNDNNFIYCSPSCKRITGYDQKDFLRNPDLMTRIIYPDDFKKYVNHINDENSTKPCNGIDYRIISRSGDIRWLTHVCQPVFDDHGSVIGRRGTGRDITDRMNSGIQLRELNKKLKSLNADKDRFISILGHDLKSPFNNILGITMVLKNELHTLSQEETENLIEALNKTAKLTNNLLEDILMWARSQQGSLPFFPKTIGIAGVCRNTIDILNMNAYAKNITIYQSIDEKMKAYADPAMLKTIFLNLISNAIKFTKSGGKISIEANENAEHVTIAVSDTGVGISLNNIAKLFDMTQVITTKGTAKETGTGLGLLLCKEFVEKHGGIIWVDSEVNKGSTFKFTLPKIN